MQLLTNKKIYHVLNIYNRTIHNIKIFNRLKHNKMNWIIKNKQTKAKHNLNTDEALQFFKMNDADKYTMKENKFDLFDLLPLWLIVALMSLAFAASLLLHIQLNY